MISFEAELRRDQEQEKESEQRSKQETGIEVHLAWTMYAFIVFLLIGIEEIIDDYPVWSMFAFGLLAALGVLVLLLMHVNREDVEEVSIDMVHRERIAEQLEKNARDRGRVLACFNAWMAAMGVLVFSICHLTGCTPLGFWEAIRDIAKVPW